MIGDNMQNITNLCASFYAQLSAFRRDLHTYPELGWTEYRTTSKIIDFFEKLQTECNEHVSYKIVMGSDAIDADSRLTPPSVQSCAKDKARAIIQGAKPNHVSCMGDGLTGLWVDMHFGKNIKINSPVIALRFDIDANNVKESSCLSHFPCKEGFVSQNEGLMHGCGHDGHTAIGIGVAQVLHHLREKLQNTDRIIRLIFQPAEENAQGAKAMLVAGVMENVTTLYGIHLGIQAKNPHTLICGTTHFLANTTFEVTFEGKAAHSGLSPQEGKNALLAASSAVQALYAISRHGEGQSRVNVGQMHCFGAPNVVPAKATLCGETRGLTAQINDWMQQEAERICQASASMWNCTHTFNPIGHCVDGYSDAPLAQEVLHMAKSMPCFTNILLNDKFWASEDFTWLSQAVQKNGGQATYMQLGVEWGQKNRGHHTECFDFDENALLRGVELLARLVISKITSMDI